MEKIIITFQQVKVEEPTFFVCHAHFPGAQNVKVAPAISQETIFRQRSKAKCTIKIKDPTFYEGLCIVLLRKLHSSVVGWQPHARCRLERSASGLYQGILIEESTLNPCGKLELTIPTKWLSSTQNSEKDDKSLLLRKWFLVPSEQKEMVDQFVEKATWWFKDGGSKPYPKIQTPEEKVFLSRTHCPFWNNKQDSLPGWCFSMDLPRNPRYTEDEFESILKLASMLLFFTTEGQKREDQEQGNVIAIALVIFGGSIRYTQDLSSSKESVERFSSLGRNDGVGDCEDIAKESIMAFMELKNMNLTNNDKKNPLLAAAHSKAQEYVPALALVTVRDNRQYFAHAVAMLIPKSFFTQTDNKPSESQCLLCDGTYLCYPKYDVVNNWKRPYEYRYVVSAMLCEPLYDEHGKTTREIYFKYTDEPNSYAVKLKDLCMNRSRVSWERTHALLSKDQEQTFQNILTANRPIVSSTLTGEWTVAERFIILQRRKLQTLLGFPIPLVFPTNTSQIKDYIKKDVEYTGVVKGTSYVMNGVGTFGAVDRPYLGAVGGGWHSHNIQVNHSEKFSPPSHYDIIVFIAMRATGMYLNEKTLFKIELICALKSVYEMTESHFLKGNAKNACQIIADRLRMRLRMRLTTANSVTVYKVASKLTKALLSEGGDKSIIRQAENMVALRKMFTDEEACEEYLRLYEIVGITIVRLEREKRQEMITFLCNS